MVGYNNIQIYKIVYRAILFTKFNNKGVDVMNAEKAVDGALSIAERASISLEILITGFVVVFAVLILLILLITLYGNIVSKAEKAISDKKAEKETAVKAEKAVKAPVQAVTPVSAPVPANGIPDEVIAVIAAAVDAMYGEGTVKVKSIKRVPQSRPVWSTAGIMENTRPF